MLRRICAAALAAMLCVTGLIQPASAQEREGQATVTGRVLDAESGAPIDAVAVRLAGERGEFVGATDDQGAFLFARVPSGAYEIVLEHLAYGTRSDSLEVDPGVLVNLELRLRMEPIELEPLVVVAEQRSVSPMLLGFYERMSMDVGGRFITREDIEDRQPVRITHMIQDLPSVTVVTASGPFGGRSCNAAPWFRGKWQRSSSGALWRCYPNVYVDGIELSRGPGGSVGPVCLDDFVVPSEVEAIEVYKGAASLPAEFGGSSGRCGVIVIWTRRGT